MVSGIPPFTWRAETGYLPPPGFATTFLGPARSNPNVYYGPPPPNSAPLLALSHPVVVCAPVPPPNPHPIATPLPPSPVYHHHHHHSSPPMPPPPPAPMYHYPPPGFPHPVGPSHPHYPGTLPGQEVIFGPTADFQIYWNKEEQWSEPHYHNRKEDKYRSIQVPADMTVDDLIQNLVERRGWSKSKKGDGDEKPEGWVLTEWWESGTAKWRKGNVIEFGKGSKRLREVGWGQERGKSQPPISLQLHKA